MFEVENPQTTDYTARLYDGLTSTIIAAAIEVHKALGPGLLEATYEACLIFELKQTGLKVERQKVVPVEYKDVKLDATSHKVEVDNYIFARFAPRCLLGELGVNFYRSL